MKGDDALCQPLKGAAEERKRRRRRIANSKRNQQGDSRFLYFYSAGVVSGRFTAHLKGDETKSFCTN